MSADDMGALEAIQVASVPQAASGWAAADFLNLETWVLTEGDAGVVAFLVARKVAEDEFELLNMAVAAVQRRRGLGRALLVDVLRRFEGVWFLEVRASNAAAEGLYASVGFKRTGRRRGYYSTPLEDAIEMTRVPLK